MEAQATNIMVRLVGRDRLGAIAGLIFTGRFQVDSATLHMPPFEAWSGTLKRSDITALSESLPKEKPE